MSSSFYDNFISYQIQSGINDRIYSLYKRTLKFGISNKKILEIGCGIGALTYLLSKKIENGKVEAFDSSEKSIEFAKKNIQHKNVLLEPADLLNFSPCFVPCDRILMFDVLEHIPKAKHSEAFARVREWMDEETLLLINLPNPYYILYDQKHQPEKLQELDQPIFLNDLLPILSDLSLELKYFETYSIWVKEDYQFLTIQKRKNFTEQYLSAEMSLTKRIALKFQREIRKFIFRFPKTMV